MDTPKKQKLKKNFGAKIDANMKDYANDPFFIKKAEESKVFLEKHGFPEALLKRR